MGPVEIVLFLSYQLLKEAVEDFHTVEIDVPVVSAKRPFVYDDALHRTCGHTLPCDGTDDGMSAPTSSSSSLTWFQQMNKRDF